MAKKMSLDSLIRNLENVKKNNVEISLKQIQFVYSAILKTMASHTVYDTTQMRAGILKAFCDKFGISAGILKATPLDYWEQYYGEHRAWDDADTSMSVKQSSRKYAINIKTHDEALYLYETGAFKISSLPPRDNSSFILQPIAYVSDLIKFGALSSVEGLEGALNSLIDRLITEILRG